MAVLQVATGAKNVAYGFSISLSDCRWFREVGNMLQEIHTVSILLHVLEGVLHFPKIQLSDSSNYVCVASNSLGEDRKKFKLTVTSDIIVFVRPQKQVRRLFLTPPTTYRPLRVFR